VLVKSGSKVCFDSDSLFIDGFCLDFSKFIGRITFFLFPRENLREGELLASEEF
jgi:hypothetical protein